MENQSYEDFISTVSHELRTPLTSIRGFSQTMLSSWDKLDDESKKRFLKIIEDQSNRLISLVENMLSVTKLQSSKETFVYKETDIKPIISTVVAIVKNQYKDKNFEIKVNDKTPTVTVDRDKFQQVMVNVIENAAKYSSSDTTVRVCTDCCGDFVSIKISDVGAGISDEDKSKIFNKFSRIDSPLTRKVQGSGLGLYITKNIVEKMKGEISVSSEKIESGAFLTTFEVKFPVSNIENQVREACKP